MEESANLRCAFSTRTQNSSRRECWFWAYKRLDLEALKVSTALSSFCGASLYRCTLPSRSAGQSPNRLWACIDFWTYQLVLVLDLFSNFHTNLVQVLGFVANFWLVCGQYIPGIETDIALVLNWYYLKLLPSRCWYEASITSCPYEAGTSARLVLPQVIPVCSVLWYQDQYLHTKVSAQCPANTGPNIPNKKHLCYYLLLPSFDGFLLSKADWIQAQHHFHHHMRKKILTWLQMLKNCVQWKLTDHPNRFHAMKKLLSSSNKVACNKEAPKPQQQNCMQWMKLTNMETCYLWQTEK